ncbi:type VI secretion protein [Photobacterium jeanii]|uniref:Type VI secretion protein n=1 Tax=Photobacterium jeanii TaxID=858640 RepID=A0A178K178_9GAMM|nr:type VI secretion system protein TssA [Photobacterium jeanii]OAN11060.1 type VI secretion protein [Photobacterium jeanii]PST90574.1 type VI secretion system protein TssA [Photobacterium jeanii]
MAILPFEESAQVDIDSLVSPIDAEQPCGQDPRMDASPTSVYYQLKNVRNNARTAERSALIDGEPLLSFANQWRPLVERVPNILLEEAKDLEYTAWYIEALTRNYGFAGLCHGFTIAKILIEEFWDTLYPMPDEDGIETRVAPLVGLNGVEGEGTLLMPIACIPLTEFDGEQAYALWEYEQACEVERFDEEKKRYRLDQGAIELKRVEAAVEMSSSKFFIELVTDIEKTIQAYDALVQVMDQATGLSLSTSHISKRLHDALTAVKYLAGDKLEVENDIASEFLDISPNMPVNDAGNQTANIAQQQLNSRQDAIAELKRISTFFRKTEPHSPMSYAIDQVVRWSDLALPDLLAELIDDGSAREGYFKLVGISSDNDATS